MPPASHGVPQIEVKFDIDTNSILSVIAINQDTKKAGHNYYEWLVAEDLP